MELRGVSLLGKLEHVVELAGDSIRVLAKKIDIL